MPKPSRWLLLVLSGALAACGDSASPPKPTTVAFVTALPTGSLAGLPVAIATVVVKDEKGNPMSGQPLAITVSGGGTITGAPTSTQTGPTSIGTWTLATKVGANAITVSSGSLTPVTISVQGVAGPPAKVTAAAVTPVSTVGKAVTVPFAVVDAFDNGVAGATVQLNATGGGSLSATSVVSDANGTANVTWTLGNVRGANTLTTTVGTVVTPFTTVAQADVPAVINIVQGDAQTSNAGAAVAVPPRVTMFDRFGNAASSASAVFTVASGGGTLLGATTIAADTNGVVTGPSWFLGKRNVPQSLVVTAGTASQVFTASIRTSYKITLRFLGTPTDAQKAIFQGAAARVSAAITQGAPPASAVAFPLATACGLTGFPPLTETIDGIVIYAGITPIDGPGKILAQAGPCAFRSGTFGFLPAIAVVHFDEADLTALSSGGSLEDVATHEMLHSVGYGTLWSNLLVTGAVDVDPRYIGVNGRQGCSMFGAPPLCASIPLENTGGQGTAGAHWRETTFANELMTGYLNAGVNPLSTMSIGSLIDLGYAVSLTAADAYTVPTAIRAPMVPSMATGPWENVRQPIAPNDLEAVGTLLMRPWTRIP